MVTVNGNKLSFIAGLPIVIVALAATAPIILLIVGLAVGPFLLAFAIQQFVGGVTSGVKFRKKNKIECKTNKNTWTFSWRRPV